MKIITLVVLGIVLVGCESTMKTPLAKVDSSGVEIIDDRRLYRLFGKKINDMMAEGELPYASGEEIRDQLGRASCDLVLPNPGKDLPMYQNIYQESVDKVVMMGRSYRCPKKSCKRIHWSIASGVLIHPDGVVATNYHVVDAAGDTKAMAAMTHGGELYPVSEVLAADKKSDVAILKLSGAKDLPAAIIAPDEPVGNPVTVISHPKSKFYMLTKGYVSRYFYREPGVPFMNITADYAKGSSGGPLFNQNGHLIGLVSSTTSLAARSVPVNHAQGESGDKDGSEKESNAGKKTFIGQNHQMTLKNCVPSRAILSLIEE